ncbi:DUF4917 family protein [Legionella norrlandica]|uniref:DUF4917 family protein n=1 Tax=Legionella norrlandica TaxID=1498499 RepID=UPI00069131BD|nr:DUF4917 family protein [Legionella norrlandica]
MESNKTLLVGCGINIAFNQAFNVKSSFFRSNFTYAEILPTMFNDTSDSCDLKSKFKMYLNNYNNDLEEFLRYDFSSAIGSLCENEREEIKNEFIRILGQNHREPTFKLSLQDGDFQPFKENVKAYNRIYTTNFDLKLYFLMAKLELFGNKNNKYKSFNDCFYLRKNENCNVGDFEIYPFNETNPKFWSLVYLHGSMHLFSHSETGFDALKIANVQSRNLIEKREKLCRNGQFHDLFVLGGTTEEKLNIIEHNSYLKKALESLKNIEGDLVIYGCSIDDNDAHIWKAICDSRVNNIYIGISTDCSDRNFDRINEHFKNKKITFYCHDDNNIWEDGWINK